MLMMTTITQRQMKRYRIDHHELNYHPISKKIKRQVIAQDWSIQNNQQFKEEEYHCQVYLKFFPSTLKCSIDVIVKSTKKFIAEDDNDSILIGKTRIPRIIKPGVIRVRLVSSLFDADPDVHEDPSLIKFETIKNQTFEKQFALVFRNTRIGPGPIGKFFLESLDPSNGSYTSNPPIFELNLSLSTEHEILSTSSHQKSEISSPLECGCILSSESSHLTISDRCNLILNDTKLIHRLSEPLRCQWKSIGRELSPCFSEIDLTDLNQRYFLSDGNHECTYQLLREWFIRDPTQANIRYLLTRFHLPFQLILTIHNDIIRTFLSS